MTIETIKEQAKLFGINGVVDKLKSKEEMNFVEYAISEGYTYNNENNYFYKEGKNYMTSDLRDKYIKEVVMLIDIKKYL
jgi:hypothetical protein